VVPSLTDGVTGIVLASVLPFPVAASFALNCHDRDLTPAHREANSGVAKMLLGVS
jgi:hypothetical protein